MGLLVFINTHGKMPRGTFLKFKWLYFVALCFYSIAPLAGQTLTGPVYWSTTKPDCSTLGESTPVPVTNAAGTTLGYSCSVSGTFVWFAAGGIWGTTIRVAAPASAPIGVDYTFYDQTGNDLKLDTMINNAALSLTSSNDVNFALAADQPAEVELLGATANRPGYGTTASGSVYGVFLCRDATTCANVLPQLLYSALPAQPWSLSVPFAFDDALANQWSAVGINDNGPNPVHALSLVIYNEDTAATAFKVSVFDSQGKLIGSGMTPPIPPLKDLGGGNLGEGGTYGVFLSQVVSTLPQGVCKILVDGGTFLSAVEVLQFNGLSATTLQVAGDSAPPAATNALRTSSSGRSRSFSPRLVSPRLQW
jgi:hypothetical protein